MVRTEYESLDSVFDASRTLKFAAAAAADYVSVSSGFMIPFGERETSLKQSKWIYPYGMFVSYMAEEERGDVGV